MTDIPTQAPSVELEAMLIDATDEQAMLRARLHSIKEIIDSVENRCMAADGPVTNTRIEMTDDELRCIYRLAGGQVQS